MQPAGPARALEGMALFGARLCGLRRRKDRSHEGDAVPSARNPCRPDVHSNTLDYPLPTCHALIGNGARRSTGESGVADLGEAIGWPHPGSGSQKSWCQSRSDPCMGNRSGAPIGSTTPQFCCGDKAAIGRLLSCGSTSLLRRAARFSSRQSDSGTSHFAGPNIRNQKGV